ncbi:MAG: TIGR02300 family protein, partial [Geminicoccaceae bacterium]
MILPGRRPAGPDAVIRRPNLLLTGPGDHGNCGSLTTCSWLEYGVAKAEWGLKRTCLNCGARFYDLQREPIVCPSCGAAVDAAGPSKPRRARAAATP